VRAMRDLLIVGCGGFGREVADIVDAINDAAPTWHLLGFVDDEPSPANRERIELRGSVILGSVATARSTNPEADFVVGIGNAPTRKKIADFLEAAGLNPAVLVHPSAVIGANVDVGNGTIVAAHVAVGSDITIGRHVHLDRASQVGHDSVVEDFATVHPAGVISGNCRVGARAELGTNCTLLPGVSVGSDAVVGAAACVTKDVPAQAVVRGVPAK
jgi:sugar O-acyltransferase (sialic acid O-acetyltransferase NeuD family)